MKNILKPVIIFVIIGFVGCDKNHPPVIESASASLETVVTGESTQFVCMATDEDGDLLTYHWTCESGGFPNGRYGQSVNWLPPEKEGVYLVNVSVSDGKLSDEDSFHITVEKRNTPPRASFTFSPETGISIETEVLFDATGCDDFETPLNMLQVRWDWENDGEWDTGYSEEKTKIHTFSTAGPYTVKLEVKDEGGLVNSTTGWICASCGELGTFTDNRDENNYEYLTIGTQTWMAENLAYLPEVSPSSKGSEYNPDYYVYGYQGTDVFEAKAEDNYDNYGVLYNYSAAKVACPDGWHLPKDEEWTILTDYLINNGFGYEGSGNDIGKSMASSSGWKNSDDSGEIGNNQSSNNSSGFNAIPVGFRDNDGAFKDFGLEAIFWSSSENEGSKAWIRWLGFSLDGVERDDYHHSAGFSIRCIKD